MILKSLLHSKAPAPGAAFGKFLGAAAIGATVLLAPAHADTITFEGYSGLVGGGDSIRQAGIDVGFYANVAGGGIGNLVGIFADGTDPQSCFNGACPVNNASTYYGALNDSYLYLSAGGNGFTINAFDASFIGGNPTLSSYPALSGILRIQGNYADGSFLLEDYALNGPGPNGFEFGHFITSANFANQRFTDAFIFGFACNADANCTAFSNDRAQFGIDNLAVTVPEPSSKLMFGLGLLAMIAGVRRRKV